MILLSFYGIIFHYLKGISLHINDLVPEDELSRLVKGGFVKVREHPVFGFKIYNYTSKTQFGNFWNGYTNKLRGLIVDREGVVLARPFEKIFNYDALEHGELDFSSVERVVEKIDGSLGILYIGVDNRPYITTRGDFNSMQGERASAILRERYSDFEFLSGITYLFEIVLPENRIVVDYGVEEELYFLGAFDTESLKEIELVHPFKEPKVYNFVDIHSLYMYLLRDNFEGFVLNYKGGRYKIKSESYLMIHKILSNLTPKRVLESLRSREDLSYLDKLPDEFFTEFELIKEDLIGRYNEIRDVAERNYREIKSSLGEDYSRRDFALKVNLLPPLYKHILFLMEDSKDFSYLIYNHIEDLLEV